MTDVQQARPSALGALLTRELRVGRRIGGAVSMGVVFFLCLVDGDAVCRWAGSGPAGTDRPGDPVDGRIAATLLGLDSLFQGDAEDGSLDLLFDSEIPLELMVLIKCRRTG